MAIDIYINTDRPVDRAVVVGPSSPAKDVNLDSIFEGTQPIINIYAIKNDGTPDSRSGDSGVSVSYEINRNDVNPVSGDYTITDGTDTTDRIPYNASSAFVEGALNRLNSDTGPNGTLVDVAKDDLGNYLVTFRQNGAQSLLTGTSVNLYPDSTISTENVVVGDGSTKAQQSINPETLAAISQNSWTSVSNSFTGTIDATTARFLQAAESDESNYCLTIKFDQVTVCRQKILLKKAEFDLGQLEADKLDFIDLAVANPRISGVAAVINALGEATDDSKWLKTGPNNTDWEQILISSNGEFLANIALADSTGIVLPDGVIGRIGRDVYVGDGATEKGLLAANIPKGVYYIDIENGNDSIASGNSLNAYATIQAAFEAAIADNPDHAYMIFKGGLYDLNGNSYVADTASSTIFHIYFEPVAAFKNAGIILDNTSGDLNVADISGHFALGGNDFPTTPSGVPQLYIGPSMTDDFLLIDARHFTNLSNNGGFTGGFFELTGGNCVINNLYFHDELPGTVGNLIIVSGGKMFLKSAILGTNGTGLGYDSVFFLVKSGATLVAEDVSLKWTTLALQETTDAKVVVKNVLHSTTKGSRMVGALAANTDLYLVGANYSVNALAPNTNPITTFGSFTQADPLAIIQ